MNNKRDSYRKWLYTDHLVGRRREDFMNDDSYLAFHNDAREILNQSKEVWIEEFYFDKWKGEKKCERMDSFFSEFGLYHLSEQDFFLNNIYHKILASRESNDSQQIENLIEKEKEQFWESENDFW
ncbi:hypothetical protein D0T84_18375 [Dysgonomonas sp. 521]|uniref:hypothetical protein n=1 Tax=Dysgonomonas sp. 521 TaxID=2302932 RepID=UPI0013D0B938|nr:hypothetical protein [Dysgonomonas sp. 521]NDV96857.1 hypothetical protein [Dysgonomonas sp. 521]